MGCYMLFWTGLSHFGFRPGEFCVCLYFDEANPLTCQERPQALIFRRSKPCWGGISWLQRWFAERQDNLLSGELYEKETGAPGVVFDWYSVSADIIGQNTSFAWNWPIQNMAESDDIRHFGQYYRPKCHFCQISLSAETEKIYVGRTLFLMITTTRH